MDYSNKSREELISELQELLQKNDSLRALKEKRADELVMANKELAYQNEQKEKRAAELVTANNELVFQNREKEKRADELVMANKELAFQNEEKEKRAAELNTANKELAYQNELKEKRAIDLVITNKKLQQLIQLNKDKDKFFSIITHDLKNPFNSIIGFSELLIEQIKEKNYKKIEEFANTIFQSSNRAMDLLMNLMAWAQSQSGRMDFNPEYFNIITLINEVTLLLNDIAGQKSIRIESKLPPCIQVNADKEMISTVLRNLISNAIKFIKPEGTITISAVDKQNEFTFSVSDTGVGISKGRIDKLFNISDGYSTPGTQNEKGTGLGLILCKEFIIKNKGKIWVESEVGLGSVFYFTIPSYAIGENKEQIKNAIESNKEKEYQSISENLSLKILVADDDETSSQLVSIALQKLGKEIIHVQTGTEAVETCRANPDIDLVLMDIQMPGINGYEATRQIRQFNKKVIIIAQTAFALVGDNEKAIEAGCNDYISKPINKVELLSLIHKYFKK